MPRGKYVNHKGRRRHFTSPEELEQQVEDEETSSEEGSSSDENDDKPSGSRSTRSGKSASGKRVTDSSSESEEEVDRDARKGVAGLIEINNPNRQVKKLEEKLDKIDLESKAVLTTSEKKLIAKQKAKRRYEKLHAEGKTAQAKSDLARLALIRQQREEAAAKREAEKKAAEEKKNAEKERTNANKII